MATKVAILGTVPNSRAVVPFEDSDWDIWVCSGGNSQTNAPPRITEWYELHALVDCRGPENKNWWPTYIQWVNSQAFPVWMQERNPEVPRAWRFPWRDLIKEYGPDNKRANWWTSSITWMMGFALYRGYKTIGVFGVDMASAQEHYTGQKAGIQRWCEIIREHGAEPVIPLESSLGFTYPIYGYAEASRYGRHSCIREIEADQRIQHMRNQIGALQRDLAYHEGAKEQLTFERRTFVSGLDAEIDETGDPGYPPGLLNRDVAHVGEAAASGRTLPSGEQWEQRGDLLVPAKIVPTNPDKPPTASAFSGHPDAALLASDAPKANGAGVAAPAETAAPGKRGKKKEAEATAG